MKRNWLFMFCLVGTMSMVSAQDNEVKLIKVDTLAPVQDLCKALPTSHWSFQVKGGGNFYRMPPDAVQELDRLNMSLGGGLEYTINPLIGIGLEYVYSDYSRPYTYLGTVGNLVANTHDFLLVGSVNLSNAFSPNRKGFWKYVNLYGDFGGGLALFTCKEAGAVVSSGSPAAMGKLGLNMEFTLGKAVNLGLGGEYRQYDALYMTNGRSNRNCDGLLLTLGLRFKLGTKDKAHARDTRLCHLSPSPEPIVITKTYRNADTDATVARLKAVQAENATLKQKLQKRQEEASKAVK